MSRDGRVLDRAAILAVTPVLAGTAGARARAELPVRRRLTRSLPGRLIP